MVTVLLMVLAAEAASIESQADEVEQRRTRPRLHASVGGGASGAFTPSALGVGAAGGGVAFKGELGVLFGDRFSVLVRAGAGTTVVFGSLFQGGLGVAASWGDHLLIGAGAEAAVLGVFSIATDQVPSAALVFPFRISWSPGDRAVAAVSRKGLQLSFELSPGLTLTPLGGALRSAVTPARSFALGGSAWVSYAWW